MMNLLKQDIELLNQKGITEEMLRSQLSFFQKGIPPVVLAAPATTNDGIMVLTDIEKERCVSWFEMKKEELDIVKFVPASGAATRMFQSLFTFLKEFKPSEESFNAYVNRMMAPELQVFYVGFEKFPFYKNVERYIAEKLPEFNSLSDSWQKWHLANVLLDKGALNYSSLPKGLFPFHQYYDSIITAFEEHLYESALYAVSQQRARLHFTIAEEHLTLFQHKFNNVEKEISQKTAVEFSVQYSFQKQRTDTLAVTSDNIPFRDENQQLFFRPAGHGALLENLNEVQSDIVFIQNIDNVVMRRYEPTIAYYKKILAGKLLELQERSFKYVSQIDSGVIKKKELPELLEFLKELNVVVPTMVHKYTKKYMLEYVRRKLDRPIRVCGMVKNEGDPGGGPFWIKEEERWSLQIVESAQNGFRK